MKKNTKQTKGFANAGEPLYDSSTFLYYFEQRLREIVRDEVKSQFNQSYFGMPF